MSYKVIHYFTDLSDKAHPYEVGDTYPRSGVKPTKKRIEELLSNKNMQNTPLIEHVDDTEKRNDDA